MVRSVKQPLYDLNQLVKAVKSKTKSNWNHLKQFKPLNKIMLRFSQKNLVDLSKQPVESIWQQSQNKAKLFQTILKTTKCQTTSWFDISIGWNFTPF